MQFVTGEKRLSFLRSVGMCEVSIETVTKYINVHFFFSKTTRFKDR